MGRRRLTRPVQSREFCRADLLGAGGPGQPAAVLGPAVFTRAAGRGQEALGHAEALRRKGSGLLLPIHSTGANPSENSVGSLRSSAGKKAQSSPSSGRVSAAIENDTFPQASAYFSGSDQLNQPGLPAHPASGRSTLLAFFGRRSSVGEFLPWGLEKGSFWGLCGAVRRTPLVCWLAGNC